MSAPVKKPSTRPIVLLPDEHEDIRVDVKDLFADPDRWMDVTSTSAGTRRAR